MKEILVVHEGIIPQKVMDWLSRELDGCHQTLTTPDVLSRHGDNLMVDECTCQPVCFDGVVDVGGVLNGQSIFGLTPVII